MTKDKKERAYELDFLRGVAMIIMLWMHFCWDIRYEFHVDAFEYLKADWFWTFLHPFNLVLFVGVSGVCCSFSRNNIKRGIKLLAVALAFTTGTLIATKFFHIDCLIIFNVLHLLALSIFIYALVIFVEKKFKINPNLTNALLGFFGALIIAIGGEISRMDYCTNCVLVFPLGINVSGMPSQADFMPIFPWLGVFLLGALVGRTCYQEKKSLVPTDNKIVRGISAPVEFLGKHSLFIYIVHQPIMYGVLYLIFMALGKV